LIDASTHVRIQASAGLVACLALLAGFAAVASDADRRRRETRFEELSKKADVDGKIWILISVRVADRVPEGTLHKQDPGLVEAQRAFIRQKQHDILRSIQVAPDDPEVRLYLVGAISVKVDRHQLSILRDHPDVADAAEPRISRVSRAAIPAESAAGDAIH
jgi:hypothetical protein